MTRRMRTTAAPAESGVVTMRQARIALSRAGRLSQVEELIANMPGQAGDEARIEWEFSNEVRRRQPLVVQLGPALGLSEGDLDQLFETAASL